MKAPDKIYLEKSLSNPDRLHSQWYPNDVIGGGIEYIRKDALIELIKEESKFWDDGEMIFRGLIDKLNSM